ncbi:MAG: aspartyl protease family protein [Thermoanaerobaculia bacterium]
MMHVDRRISRCTRGLVVVTLAVLAMSPLWAEQSERDRTEQWFGEAGLARAKAKFLSRDFVEAGISLIGYLRDHPESGAAHYAFVQTLMKMRAGERARSAAEKALEEAPNQALAHVAMGDVYFEEGNFPAAGPEYVKARELDPKVARAYVGLGRIFETERRLKTARAHFEQAYLLDPQDPAVLLAMAESAPTNRVAASFWRRYAKAATYESKGARKQLERRADLLEFLGDRGSCRPRDVRAHTTVRLAPVRRPGSTTTRHALPVAINGAKPGDLMLDTGGNGFLVPESYADKAGLQRIDFEEYGSGAVGGLRVIPLALARTIAVGEVILEDCLVGISPDPQPEHDYGTVGTEVFSRDFIVTLDLPRSMFELAVHPQRPAPDEPVYGYNRDVTKESDGFTPIRVLDSKILIPTLVNGEVGTYFLLDSGASRSFISLRLAVGLGELVDAPVRIIGFAGEVSDPKQIADVRLQFAGAVQDHDHMLVLDLRHLRWGLGHDIGGILGVPSLNLFKLTIDYRNGLIKVAR